MFKEILIVIGLLAVIFTFVGFMASQENSEPCEYFKNTPAKNLPGRCIGYFNNQ